MERKVKMTSTTGCGRLGNQIIRNIAVSMVAEKHDLYVQYCSIDLIQEELGIFLFVGEKKYASTVKLTDTNYFSILNASDFSYNLFPNNNYFQTKEITGLLNTYLQRVETKKNIMNKNPFQNRYNNNNDLYIYVRLTDTAQWNPGINYYLNTIEKIQFDNIYMSTDDKEHDIIKKILKKYPLCNIITYEEVNTIQFASTCKHIILSHGSFSGMIGHLSFFSQVYYPKFEVNKIWCGDIFSIEGWTKVEDF